MLKSACLAVLALMFATSALAADTPPSAESIKQLLTITDARKLTDGMMIQVDGMMKNAMQQALHGRSITAKQQKAINDMQAKTAALLKQELNWGSLEPMYIGLYRDSFTQDEINGMLAFYRTPAGQAVIKKMPVLMRNTMVEMQKRMAGLMPKLQQIEQETLAELKTQPGK